MAELPDPPHTSDGRALSREQLAAARRGVADLFRSGVPVMRIVARTGLSWPTVRKAIDLAERGGPDALLPAARGVLPGTGRVLSPEQEAETRRLLFSRPKTLGLPEGLWSRNSLIQLIAQRFGLALTEQAVGHYLRRWGIVIQPSGPPVARCTPAIQRWFKQYGSQLEAAAEREGAAIYWMNQGPQLNLTLWNQPAAGRMKEGRETLAPRRPVILASVTSRRGRLMWKLCSGRSLSPKCQSSLIFALARTPKQHRFWLIRCDGVTYRGDLPAPPVSIVKLFPKMEGGRPVDAFASDELQRRFTASNKVRGGGWGVRPEDDHVVDDDYL